MSETSQKTTGRVKWFNKNAGYGFITALDGDHKDDDIFVHHSAVHVSSDQFRYLVEGEYVLFNASESDNSSGSHKWQSADVTGIHGGPLMCETQNDSRNSRPRDDDSDHVNTVSSESSQHSRQRRSSQRYRGGGPRVTDSNGVEYRLVRNNHKGNRTQDHSSCTT